MYEYIQKSPENFRGFLYYARVIDPTILMELYSLVALHTKPTIKTAKKHLFSNYSATHPDAVTEYRRSRMIIHIYSDAFYISETKERSRSGRHYY